LIAFEHIGQGRYKKIIIINKNRVLKEERRNKENSITRPYNRISFAISTYGQHIQLKTS
jgi:hypothetical protein